MKNPSAKESKAWGRGEHSNMPKEVKMVDYPKVAMRSDDLNDTITGIDAVSSKSVSTSKRHLSNQH